jgi:hypothetical protein
MFAGLEFPTNMRYLKCIATVLTSLCDQPQSLLAEGVGWGKSDTLLAPVGFAVLQR